MKSKTKNNKLPKSDKSRLSDLAPENDARGGRIAPQASSQSKKHLIKYPPPLA